MKEKKVELIIQLTANAIAVQVPESAKSFDVWEATMSLRGRKKGDNVLGFDGDKVATINLPPGQWSILGMSDVLTEEQWEKVVDQKFVAESFGHGMVFFDYKRSEEKQMKCWTCATATESAISLLKSKGVTTPHLILIKNG